MPNPDHADAVCVCGHKKSEHVKRGTGECLADGCWPLTRNGPLCKSYNPELNWPPTPGPYWCRLRDGTLLLVEARERTHHAPHADIVIHFCDPTNWGSDGWQVRMQVAGAKFAKVIEQNPFAGK